MNNNSWSSPYARIVGASPQTWRVQRRVDGVTLEGESRGIVIEYRDIEIDMIFNYKGVEVKKLSSFCAWFDMSEETKWATDHWNITQDSEAQIVGTCSVSHDYAVLTEGGGGLFMTRLFCIDDAASEDFKKYAGVEKRDLVNGVIFSSAMSAQENRERQDQAKKTFFDGSSRLTDAWKADLERIYNELMQG